MRENADIILEQPLDEDRFKKKFPFNLEPEKEEKPEFTVPTQAPVVTVKVEEKKKSLDEIAREKYEANMKNLKEREQEQLNYLEIIV